MANGIIVINKPQEWTNMDVCTEVRDVPHERRVGCVGVLDPVATDVLPIFVGRATRAMEFISESEKEYVAELRLGVVTNTRDTTGQVVEERPVEMDRVALEEALAAFRGEITQIPPMCFVLKRGGKKLYELAQTGKEVKRAPRPVTIYALKVLNQIGPDHYTLRVRCSKGTYVHIPCHDIGAALGCGGCMPALHHTKAAGLSLAEAVLLEASLDVPDSAVLLRSVGVYFFRYPAVTVEGTALREAKNDNPFPYSATDGDWRAYGPDGEFLLLGWYAGGMMSAIKSFFEV